MSKTELLGAFYQPIHDDIINCNTSSSIWHEVSRYSVNKLRPGHGHETYRTLSVFFPPVNLTFSNKTDRILCDLSLPSRNGQHPVRFKSDTKRPASWPFCSTNDPNSLLNRKDGTLMLSVFCFVSRNKTVRVRSSSQGWAHAPIKYWIPGYKNVSRYNNSPSFLTSLN